MRCCSRIAAIIWSSVAVCAQAAELSLPDTSVAPGAVFGLDLQATDLLGVGAITLRIAYDANVLEYQGLHSGVVGVDFASSAAGDTIRIAWADMSGETPISLVSGRLLTLDFQATGAGGSSSSLGFAPGCELANGVGNLLEVVYGPGAVTVLPLLYNVPASRLVITEVNLSIWTSQVQLTDVTGGSSVQVYYDQGTNRRGPFSLWDNSSGVAGSSISFPNIVAKIDSLDADASFGYASTSGALELVTQDLEHLIQAAVRTSNAGGDNSRTFPALADVQGNSAALGARELLIPNLSNDATYRPSVVLVNPGSEAVTAQVRLLGSAGSQLTSASRTLAGHEMYVMANELRNPAVPAYYSNATALVSVTAGSGRVMASGQTATWTPGDPAAHLAVQAGAGYANSPEPLKIISEVNWTNPWVSEVQLIDVTGGSVLQAYYCSGGSRHGPVALWDNSTGGPFRSKTFANIVKSVGGDSLTSGALELSTQDASHLIHAAVRTHNREGRSRTFPALGEHVANTAAVGRSLLIPDISNNSTYRCSVVLHNPTTESMTAEVKIIGTAGSQVGATMTRVLAGHEMHVLATDTPLRQRTYSNATIRVDVTAGTGHILASGQTAANYLNDPAAHIAVQAQ